MVGFTHIAFGALIGANFGNKEILLASFGSILPDIDTNFSTVNRVLKTGKQNQFSHRGIMHSLSIPSLIFLVYWLIFQNMGIIPFIAGYLSHILLDMFNPKGVPLLSPFTRKRFKMPISIETGSLYDKALGFIFIALFIVFLII